MELLARLSNVPPDALQLLAEQLRKRGARVIFERPGAGRVEHPLGKLTFHHDGKQMLSVFLVGDLGSLGRSIITGRIRKTVEESVELFRETAR